MDSKIYYKFLICLAAIFVSLSGCIDSTKEMSSILQKVRAQGLYHQKFETQRSILPSHADCVYDEN